MVRKSFFLLLILFFSTVCSFSQDSCHYRISLITLSPGDEVYTVFGHSAIRIVDSVKHEDLIYNYGTFDFSEPNFLTKFINGKLLYYLSNEDFIPFVQYYQSEKRVITEQVLNLNCEEKKNIIAFLYNNLQGGNKFYKYDFLSDNCTTRLRDLIRKNTVHKVQFKRVVGRNAYYRQLLHADLDYHDHQWIKLGIDLLLGSRTDKVMSDEQVMFLPDYLMNTLSWTTTDNKNIVLHKFNLSTDVAPDEKMIFIFRPLIIFSILALFIIYLTWINKKRINEILRRFDALMYFLFGTIGIVLIYLWLISDQVNYRDNYNLIWALPCHFVFSFLSMKPARWANYYFKGTSIIYALLLITWFFLPQHLNVALIPLVVMVMFRSWMRANEFKK